MNLNGLLWYGTAWIVGLVLMAWMRKIRDNNNETQRLMRENWDYDDDDLLGDCAKFLGRLIGAILYLIGSIAWAHMLGNSCLPNYFEAWQYAIYALFIQGAIAYAIWEKKPDNQAEKVSSD